MGRLERQGMSLQEVVMAERELLSWLHVYWTAFKNAILLCFFLKRVCFGYV
jgi:hypothetical protein